MKLRSHYGFSLIELMVVITVGAILAALALPSFRTYIANNNLTQAANGALAAFNIAREEAIKRNTYVRVDPVTCNGAASWACGGFVWVPVAPATDTPPTSPNIGNASLPIVSGAPTASGATGYNGGKITATPAPTAVTVCYSGSGRVNVNAAGSACTTSNTAAITNLNGGTSALTIKFCDSTLTVKTGPVLNLSLSGRTSITPNQACP